MRPQTRPSKPLTNQEIFDHIWQHFIVEGNPKSEKDFTGGKKFCIYAGTGCAVGCMLTLEDAEVCDGTHDELDCGNDIISIQRYRDEIYNGYFNGASINLLDELQYAHDNFFGNFEKELIHVAKKYNLKVPNGN